MVLKIEESRKGYRKRLEIVRDILTLLEVADTNGCKKTHIMYGANLSYQLLRRYTQDIIDSGLVEYDGETYYTITKKGQMFLEYYEEYEKKLRELEEHFSWLKGGREIMEKMLNSYGETDE